MRSILCIILCITIFALKDASATNLNSAEEGRCLAWMVRRVAGVDIPDLPTPTNTGPSRQGKRGPVGMKGEPGIQGPPGTCRCDMNEIASLRAENEAMAGNIRRLNTEMADVKSRIMALETNTRETTTQVVEIAAVSIQCVHIVRSNAGIFRNEVTAVRCPSGCKTSGTVWGTSIYTDDSTVCKAAIHDGRISNGGGLAFVKKMPGQRSYTASIANGIATNNYGSWDGSYKFCNGMEC